MSREPASSQLAGTAGQVMQSAGGRRSLCPKPGRKVSADPPARAPRETRHPPPQSAKAIGESMTARGNTTSGPGSGQRPAAQLLVESPRSLFATCVLAGQGVRCRREPLSYAELEVLG